MSDLVERLTTHARIERLIVAGKREDDELRYKVRALRQHAALVEEAADELAHQPRPAARAADRGPH